VRRKSYIEYLKKEVSFKLVYIEADIKKRHERIIRRGENPDDKKKTFEQFKKDHKGEAESQIEDLKKIADYLIDNNGSFDHLYSRLDKIIRELKK
jgi:dephospho-CoA kinase